MKPSNIPITTVSFSLPVHPGMMRYFRGAVIESVMSFKAVFESANISTELFHNHIEQPRTDDTTNRYFHYPLIQYKIRRRHAEIMGIGKGAQALQLWLSLIGDTIWIKEEEYTFQIHHHHHDRWIPKLFDKTYPYRLNKWLAFNPKNFDSWKQTPRLTDKAMILDKLIWGHIFHLVEGLELDIDRKQLQLFVSTIDWMGFKDCYGIQKQALDITFYTNLNLPEEIGLGQGTTLGFGKVQSIRKTERRKKSKKQITKETVGK